MIYFETTIWGWIARLQITLSLKPRKSKAFESSFCNLPSKLYWGWPSGQMHAKGIIKVLIHGQAGNHPNYNFIFLRVICLFVCSKRSSSAIKWVATC